MVDETVSVHDMHLCRTVGFGHPVIEQLILELRYFHEFSVSTFPAPS